MTGSLCIVWNKATWHTRSGVGDGFSMFGIKLYGQSSSGEGNGFLTVGKSFSVMQILVPSSEHWDAVCK